MINANNQPEGVHRICKTCAEANGGAWKSTQLMVDLFLGPCQVCKKITAITHLLYWKGLNPKQKFTLPKLNQSRKSNDTVAVNSKDK